MAEVIRVDDQGKGGERKKVNLNDIAVRSALQGGGKERKITGIRQ